MIKTYKLLFIMLFINIINISAQKRIEIVLDKGWKFTHKDSVSFIKSNFDDSEWQSVTIPHDWAIAGPFDIYKDQNLKETEEQFKEHACRTGGLPYMGVGWYRKTLSIPQFQKGKRAFILFDGAMSHSNIYINDKKVGEWPYGYNSFWFDITSYLNFNEKNTIAVRLENPIESSRWYPGAGLYRNVHLIITGDAYIPVWGTYVTTPIVTKKFAKIKIETKVNLPKESTPSQFFIKTTIEDPKGHKLVEKKNSLKDLFYNEGKVVQEFIVNDPELWSTDTPNLYKAISKIYNNKDEIKDDYSTRFGIRSIKIIPNQGFFINGDRIVFKGVCNHHDLGPLGIAVNDAAIRRQIRILKDMGCNAIRTSHNMPAPELVRACDEMGMMIMAESFDEWELGKCLNSYHTLFKKWVEKDLKNLIHHYRNNPSVVMWCIGNEVLSQRYEGGCKISKNLQDLCHREDPTRPVTQGMDAPQIVVNNNFAAVTDIPGFNYRPFLYQEDYNKLPQQIILGSETASTVSSRGIYKFPVERKAMAVYDDFQSSSYDVEHCAWSNLPEDDFIQHDDYPYCIGQFVWTGFDYLGEPTPYGTNWPNHSSFFGIIDLAGIPKDRYYLYRSHWNEKKETLHILPHWNWKGREGEITPIFVYTNYPSAELFINGKSQGKRIKDLSIKTEGSYTEVAQKNFTRQKRYRLMWMDTKYEPGIVKVVAYDKNGKAVAEKEIHTAGKPHHIVLSADRYNLKADGKDLSFINVKIVDKDGNFCPTETRQIKFKVKGAGIFRAAANGNSASIESFQVPYMNLFSGQLTAIVQTKEFGGKIIFEASAPGVKSSEIELISH